MTAWIGVISLPFLVSSFFAYICSVRKHDLAIVFAITMSLEHTVVRGHRMFPRGIDHCHPAPQGHIVPLKLMKSFVPPLKVLGISVKRTLFCSFAAARHLKSLHSNPVQREIQLLQIVHEDTIGLSPDRNPPSAPVRIHV